MQPGPDSFCREVLAQGVPRGRADHVEMKDVLGVACDLGEDDVGHPRERGRVPPRDSLPGRVPGIELAELDPQERRLQGVEPAVVALGVVDVFARLPMLAQPAHRLEERSLPAPARDGAALAE
jgi:hypothetical protein